MGVPYSCLWFVYFSPFRNIRCFKNKLHNLRNFLSKINDGRTWSGIFMLWGSGEQCTDLPTSLSHYWRQWCPQPEGSFSQPPLQLNDPWVWILTLAERQGILLEHLLKRGEVGLPILCPVAWSLDVMAGTPTALTSRLWNGKWRPGMTDWKWTTQWRDKQQTSFTKISNYLEK